MRTQIIIGAFIAALGITVAVQQGGAQQNAPVAGQEKQEKQARRPPPGVTVKGEVKNFVPVTEAMMRNPDPGDWLMLRRDYKATNYSPLSEINTQNVSNLRLVELGHAGRRQQRKPARSDCS